VRFVCLGPCGMLRLSNWFFIQTGFLSGADDFLSGAPGRNLAYGGRAEAPAMPKMPRIIFVGATLPFSLNPPSHLAHPPYRHRAALPHHSSAVHLFFHQIVTVARRIAPFVNFSRCFAISPGSPAVPPTSTLPRRCLAYCRGHGRAHGLRRRDHVRRSDGGGS
jgi:hypothetical protein